MRWLASVPFTILLIALALVLTVLVGAARFVIRTILLIRGVEVSGPGDAASMALARRFLAFLDGRCWKCGAHVVND
jgi:hypothetical protein